MEKTAAGTSGRGEKKNSKRTSVILVAVLLLGLALMAYSPLAAYVNSFTQSAYVSNYEAASSGVSAAERARLIEEAQTYNAKLLQQSDRFSPTTEVHAQYESLLNVDPAGAIGYLDIPKINVSLPIFRGTTTDVLQAGIGHLEGSSLPVGGENTHSVLTGHRGLPTSKLLRDLDKLTEGDTFSVTVLGQTLTYQVREIRIVEPDDTRSLAISPGEDLITLVTCTPYTVNSQRLLVTGVRTGSAGADAAAEAITLDPLTVACFLAVPFLIAAGAWVVIRSFRK